MGALCVSIFQGYITWVLSYPVISAMIQFAILGTFGEVVSRWIINKNIKYPFSFGITLWKMLTWAILAVGIKYAFRGYMGFVKELVEHGYLPQSGKLGTAFMISAMMNLQFGLFLVIFHRVLDNIPIKAKNWNNLHKGMYSLLWFWIPAHTFTFMLEDVYRIGLAALWSVVLGLILGSFNRR